MRNEQAHESQSLTLEEVTRNARELLLAQGKHTPTLLIEGDQRTLGVLLEDVPGTHEQRIRQMFVVGFAVAQSGEVGQLQQVFYISEGWMSTAEAGQTLDVLPSQDPQRREILLVSSFRPENAAMQIAVIEMLRDGEGILREFKDFSPEGASHEQVESPLLRAFAAGYRQGGLWTTDREDRPEA